MSEDQTRPRILAFAPVFNEQDRVGPLLDGFDRILSKGIVDAVLIVDDGSTDTTPSVLQEHPKLQVIAHGANEGIGASIRDAYRYALDHGFGIFVIAAGNGKDDPGLIPSLIDPILEGRADYVQGSRFLTGGLSEGLPRHRLLMMRAFTRTFSLLVGHRLTDGSNGFRAYRTALLKDPRVDWNQAWIGDGYQLEYYIHFKAISCGYRFLEVPVTKIYRRAQDGSYSKFHARNWLPSLKPMFLLRFGLRK
jgi:dolichol-phosphate mannosyltransferase